MEKVTGHYLLNDGSRTRSRVAGIIPDDFVSTLLDEGYVVLDSRLDLFGDSQRLTAYYRHPSFPPAFLDDDRNVDRPPSPSKWTLSDFEKGDTVKVLFFGKPNGNHRTKGMTGTVVAINAYYVRVDLGSEGRVLFEPSELEILEKAPIETVTTEKKVSGVTITVKHPKTTTVTITTN